jgi:hypothetical protein
LDVVGASLRVRDEGLLALGGACGAKHSAFQQLTDEEAQFIGALPYCSLNQTWKILPLFQSWLQ